ncbi:MAG: quinone oxidoreductase [Armatimonadetes bacterium]|nr:quinone oxidoreductase [Armatimonadota bacterium]
MKSVRIHATGGPEVLRYEEAPTPVQGEGQALVRLRAIGVNFIDIYHRSGQYTLTLPAIIGQEGAGVVESVGPGVTEVKPGDRVAYSNVPASYAEFAAVPAWRCVSVPAPVGFEQAAAAMLQGMTAHYLSHTTYPLTRGETALIHAAAGGVGALLVQMAKRRGARVIATVSTEEKAKIAREAGADEVIIYTRTDFESEVKRLTDGHGVHVVFDSVGKDTFEKSLNCLTLRGMLVLFGQASGRVPPVDPTLLNTQGSLFLTRPSLHHYTHTRQELLQHANEVLGWVASGALRLRVDRTFPLEQAAEAHAYLQSRTALGKVLLIP